VKRFEGTFLLFLSCCFATCGLTAWSQPSPQTLAPGASPPISLSTGTRIQLSVVRPVWAVSAKAGDPIYAQVSFPVVTDDRVAIPAGVYVLGTIRDVTRPTRKTNRGEIEVLFTKIIYADGYTIELPGESSAPEANAANSGTAAAGESLSAITIQVSAANDLLLDNGAQVEMTLEAPLVLDASQIAQDIPLERAPQPAQFKSATMCRYIPGSPGTPGTPGTVIPGTPGTPSTTIPGGPGMPDITIPGTPGTPATVIPGTPGTPGTPGIGCPPAPLVLSSDPIGTKTASPTSQPMAAN
jgi:hypothetical protein